MRTDLDHLPANKQRELERVVGIIFEEFEDALALATQPWKKKGRIDKIILYGSYARGGWVDEPHTAKGYRSDFDLLIIVSDKRLTERVDYWLKLDDRLIRELAIDRTLHTPVNFIVHTLQEVNEGLEDGRYFFMDMAKDGVAIYDFDGKELHQPRPKTPEEALAMAREYLEEWLPSAQSFQRGYNYALSDGDLKKAAFDLHQATERLYHTVLLVGTFYTPHVHNLALLRTQAERFDLRLVGVWPRETRTDRARFEKLKEAYVKARYSKHFKITEDDLRWLGDRVQQLELVVNEVCRARILKLEADAENQS